MVTRAEGGLTGKQAEHPGTGLNDGRASPSAYQPQSPAHHRVTGRDDRSGDQRAGNNGQRRGDGVQQVIYERNIIGCYFPGGSHTEADQGGPASYPAEPGGKMNEMSERSNAHGKQRDKYPESAAGRQSQPQANGGK